MYAIFSIMHLPDNLTDIIINNKQQYSAVQVYPCTW